MKINKDIIRKYLEEELNSDSPEFDEFESEHVFGDGEESSTCSKISTDDFAVTLNDFEVEIEERNGDVCVSGNAFASYTVTGYCEGGDADIWGHEKCGTEEGNADFSFSIDVDLSTFEFSNLCVDVE